MDTRNDIPCADAEIMIEDAYQSHVVQFREFADRVNAWLTNYEQVMAPRVMCFLEAVGSRDMESNMQILRTLTSHAEAFAAHINDALAEYEEAYKTAHSVFVKFKK